MMLNGGKFELRSSRQDLENPPKAPGLPPRTIPNAMFLDTLLNSFRSKTMIS
jgi:hypothetical protein